MEAFKCKQCGACCYGEGGICLDNAEAERIADFLGMPLESFITEYCREKRKQLYIRTGPDRYCIFYHKDRQCLIHPVKPSICSLWPFYPALIEDEEAWRAAQDACAGINPDCPFEEFVRQSRRDGD